MARQAHPHPLDLHAVEYLALAVEAFQVVEVLVGDDQKIKLSIALLLNIARDVRETYQARRIVGSAAEIDQDIAYLGAVRQAQQDAVAEPDDIAANLDRACHTCAATWCWAPGRRSCRIAALR
jgi:hypothetical protein